MMNEYDVYELPDGYSFEQTYWWLQAPLAGHGVGGSEFWRVQGSIAAGANTHTH
jgi:hypothetical protein